MNRKKNEPEHKGIVKANRTFGIEFESYGPIGAYDLLRVSVPPGFVVKGDGSIRPDYGCYATEIVTGILSPGKDEHVVREFLKTLTNKFGWKTNTSCGTHCHIGIPEYGNGLKVEELLNVLALFYTVFDPAIRSLLPHDRRDNRFCISPLMNHSSYENSNIQIDKVKKAILEYHEKNSDGTKKSKSTMNFRWGGRFGINFSSLTKHKTVEIRYHQGTLDADDILNWVALHAAIIESVMSGRVTEQMIIRYVRYKNVKSLLSGIITLSRAYLDVSTISYTIKRFNRYKDLNAHIRIPDWKTKPHDAPKMSYDGTSYVTNY